jgi:xylan 1,4-beta-xylosidase
MEAGKGRFSWQGDEKTFSLRIDGWNGSGNVRISRIDAQTGTAIPCWEAMGQPKYPSATQIEQLRAAAELPQSEILSARKGNAKEFEVKLPHNGVALLDP